MSATPTFVVSLIVGIGGLIGYIKAGSVASVGTGLISALLLAFAGSKIPSKFGYQLSISM